MLGASKKQHSQDQIEGNLPLAALMLEDLTSAGLDLSLKAADFGFIKVGPDFGAIVCYFFCDFLRRNSEKRSL